MTAAKRGRDHLLMLKNGLPVGHWLMCPCPEMVWWRGSLHCYTPPSQLATASEAVCKREGWL